MTAGTRHKSSGGTWDGQAEGPRVSVIVLSYARPWYLAEALESVVRQSYANLEVLVIDNPSNASGSIATIVSRYPGMRLIQNSANLGFSGGMNVGVRSASGEYLYLTEDDIVLDRDCIRSLVRHALMDPTAGLASGLMYNLREGTIRCAGANLRLGRTFEMEVLGQGDQDYGQFRRPFDVAYIPGAMVFSSRELWDQLGGFLDYFFMYFEDVELCVRAQRRGFRITIVPEAKVFHFEPPSQGADPDHITFHKLKNLVSLYVLHAAFPLVILLVCRLIFIELPRLIVSRSPRSSPLLHALRTTWAMKRELLRQRRAWAKYEVVKRVTRA